MQWRIQGRGLGSPGTPLVAEKKFFRDRPTPLSQGLDDRSSFPPPLLSEVLDPQLLCAASLIY